VLLRREHATLCAGIRAGLHSISELGGPGSGPKRVHDLTSERHALDVRQAFRQLRRRGEIDGGVAYLEVAKPWAEPLRVFVEVDFGAALAELEYTDPQTGRRAHEPLQLAAVPCPFGGCRWLAVCAECGRRAAVLYLRPASGFECRRCANVVHPSTRADVATRAMSIAFRLRRELGFTAREK
jgi:hypothetical protein